MENAHCHILGVAILLPKPKSRTHSCGGFNTLRFKARARFDLSLKRVCWEERSLERPFECSFRSIAAIAVD